MDVKTGPSFGWVQETHVNIKDRHHLWVKNWRTILQQMDLKKKAGITILVSDKAAFKSEPKSEEMRKNFTYLLRKKIHQEDTAILNIYTPNTREPTFVKTKVNKTK